jgi:ATP-binding cassette subfamily B protein
LYDVLIFEKEANKNREKNKGLKPFKLARDLEFRNVSFSYNTDRMVLTNLSFNIKKGEMVGLIGPSGVGKTTIVDLILRLFPFNKGKILMDGESISKIDIKQWRKNIGYIPQDIFLINNTITNNIKFYDDTISKEEIEQAAKKANIYDFIQTLPKKFSAVVGERGILLSTGQRQRIVIARILARNPKLLILDEATSALDNESEIRIQRIIESLKGKITVLVIAHRLSTVINCDRLIILEKGKIIEQGVPSELLKDKKSYFYKIYNIRE